MSITRNTYRKMSDCHHGTIEYHSLFCHPERSEGSLNLYKRGKHMDKNINIEQIVETAKKAMEDKKAENVKVIYIGEISSVADYFVICSASNSSQLEAIVDNVSESLAKQSVYSKKQEGNRNSGWILMDYGDVVIHVFLREDREFYNLDRIWSDGNFM